MPGFNPFRYRFPYTNINDINLDWIIKKVKAISEAVAHIDISRIDEIAQQAETAQQDAETALTTAQSAEAAAVSVLGIANNALTTAQSAETTAQSAETTANSVQGIANNALTTAQSAETTAQSAETTAQNAQTAVNALNDSKADKVRGATLGNFASLAASGNLLDSGYDSGDFAAAAAAVPAGGTTGQVLAKTGSADYAAAWQSPSGGTNSNLLDNWYFVGGGSQLGFGTFPINQRAQPSYSNANTYTFDRWKLTSGSLTIASNGVTLNGTIIQILPANVGLPVVASALLSDGSMITPTYDDSTKTFTLTATGETIAAVKLEIGTVQTLAHQENALWVLNDLPDYNEQFTKCRQYFRVLESAPGVGSGQFIVGIRGYSVATSVVIPVDPPMAKTITPSLPSGLQGAAIDGAGTSVSLSDVISAMSDRAYTFVLSNNLARTPISIYFNSIIHLSAEL